ncbi:NRAMP family divalent metal transporter [Hymenobacter arizonensis]|uniref:Mn2+ and Fe2+ transporters of the NRAMP family n=1 Tax=Hymenobacter arizonensis TaxID=1227077 RepID=A0A1I5XZA1_HYMAR|nr:NRAMP family divalent metal transporter [Hymenobacter arizonensis]SFQ37259.1 Mn2+ and Fe2+ transporters of the NRAMP family [Hymenobacter arizonensis]
MKPLPKARWWSGAGLGAAFLMANSSIGPGFLTQTTVFTQQLLTSFGFVILVSVLLDIGAQLNTWRILTVSELRAQDLSNKMLPGLGYFLAAMVILGGFAFNIGNLAGCGLGLNVLTGLSFETGAIISCAVALLLFWVREFGKMLDSFAKVLGMGMILLTVGVAFSAHPPVLQALHHTLLPTQISAAAIVTIVGGTVGGYITFSGAHRLLDAGIKGPAQQGVVTRSAISGIVISTIMRFVLFLAIVGVLRQGAVLDPDNPAASVFRSAAGEIGFRIFGVILWSAAISSVVGAAYTSVSFFKTFHPIFERYERVWISAFIVLSTAVFVLVGKPTQLLVFAGAVNGLILPVALGIVLVAATNRRLMQGYQHPKWMLAAGWVVVLVMGWLSVPVLIDLVGGFLK